MMIITIHSFIPLLNSIFSSTFQLWNDENNIKLTTTFTIFIIFPPFSNIEFWCFDKWNEQNSGLFNSIIIKHSWCYLNIEIEELSEYEEREKQMILMGIWSDWNAELWLLFCDFQPLSMKWTTTWKGWGWVFAL